MNKFELPDVKTEPKPTTGNAFLDVVMAHASHKIEGFRGGPGAIYLRQVPVEQTNRRTGEVITQTELQVFVDDQTMSERYSFRMYWESDPAAYLLTRQAKSNSGRSMGQIVGRLADGIVLYQATFRATQDATGEQAKPVSYHDVYINWGKRAEVIKNVIAKAAADGKVVEIAEKDRCGIKLLTDEELAARRQPATVQGPGAPTVAAGTDPFGDTGYGK